jgi:hypothetical protein
MHSRSHMTFREKSLRACGQECGYPHTESIHHDSERTCAPDCMRLFFHSPVGLHSELLWLTSYEKCADFLITKTSYGLKGEIVCVCQSRLQTNCKISANCKAEFHT